MPLPVRDVPPEDAPRVQALQLGNLVVSVDERPGDRKLSIEDTVTGDAIVWDLEKQGLRVKMTSGILIECDGPAAAEVHAVAQHFGHAAAALVVHVRPAEIADRTDQDNANTQA
jgi:hypothetical protein